MKDYTWFYRDELSIGGDWAESLDLFLSPYNPSTRVTLVFDKARSSEKHWLIHKEYGYSQSAYPPGIIFVSTADNEADYILEYAAAKLAAVDLSTARICIDITGFMRPHMMFLVKYLVERGLKGFDVIYSEPSYYSIAEKTPFSLGSVATVRQVAGFEGPINNDASRDFLIIGAGYETHLIAEVAEDKDKANKLVLLGLPSLSADMYQQNAWRTRLAADSIGESAGRKHFAPANDPFVTATVLSEIIARQNRIEPVTN